MPTPGLSLDETREYLRPSMSTGTLGLFTGAGFSLGAKNAAGKPIPGVPELKREIWRLVSKDEPDGSLADVFGVAHGSARNRLKALLADRLTVNSRTLPAWYEHWFKAPWKRAYTLNIDDLDHAAARQYRLKRPVTIQSALRDRTVSRGTDHLLSIHLNGDIQDLPDVTFSGPQYGERLAGHDPFWPWMEADLRGSPMVFVGTNLDESPLWQYVALRNQRGPRGTPEQRPRSLLISPDLSDARAQLLEQYNIRWVKATAKDFAEEVLAPLRTERDKGLARLAEDAARIRKRTTLVPVADLAAVQIERTTPYLEGARPTWGDVQSHRVAARHFEQTIPLPVASCVLVVGTRGSGVSTTLMRLAIRVQAEGREAFWAAHADSSYTSDLAHALRETPRGAVILMDDADLFGPTLQSTLNEFLSEGDDRTLVIGMRATRVDEILPQWVPGPDRVEINVPRLTRADVGAVVDALEADNRLGLLASLNREGRVAALEQQSNRDLLVAMIRATSGVELEDKAMSEYREMAVSQRSIYAVVALATEVRRRLEHIDVLVAAGATTNEGIVTLDRLIRRGLLTDDRGAISVRHRVIAELVIKAALERGEAFEAQLGLVRAIAVHHIPTARRSTETKVLRVLVSHRRLRERFGINETRRFFAETEDVLREDHHFWLQRGALELQEDNLGDARRYLATAKGRSGTDRFVEIEWAYLLLREACANPSDAPSASRWAEGSETLEAFIRDDPTRSAYPFHILARQQIDWAKRDGTTYESQRNDLEATMALIERGLEFHPNHQRLLRLTEQARTAYLSLATDS